MSAAAAPPRPIALGSAEVTLATAVLLCAAAITCGAAFMGGMEGAEPAMIATGLAGVGLAAVLSLRAERDWFNPLLLIFAAWLLRIGVPALWVAFAGPPPEFLTIFRVPARAWGQGLALALVGMTAVALGWLALPLATACAGRSFAGALGRTFRMDGRTLWTGLLFMALGLAAIVIFLRINYASSADAITTGMIRRGGSRVEGTSRYSFLATSLTTYGSVAAVSYLLLVRRARWWVGMLPALAATLVMSIFGGRVLALTPTVYAGLLLWYRGDRSRIGFGRVALAGVLAVVGAAAYSMFIAYYRAGLGLRAAERVLSMDGITFYASKVLWYEGGILHPYAVATAFPPGVLEGQSTPLTLGFVGTLAGIEGIRPGQWMVEALVGRTQDRVWGWHSGLVIDLYMNYGLLAVVLGGILFGLLLRTVYAGFRAHRANAVVACFYVMLLWHFFWVYYEHTAAAMNPVFIHLPFTVLALAGAQLLPAGAGLGLFRRPRPAPA